MNSKVAVMASVFAVGIVSPVHAAVNTLSAGITTGYEYFDRSYDNSGSSSDDDDYSRFRVSPFVTITSETTRHTANFTYAPSYWYDFDESEDDLDHRLSLEYQRLLTQHWSFSLADDLRISDEYNSYSPTVDSKTGEITSEGPGAETSGNTLRDERGRRRYTNNALSLGTAYTYYEDSSIALDYGYQLLRNDSSYSGDNYQDYDRHDISTTLAHRINTRWKTTGSLGLVEGLYDSVENDSSNLIPADSDDVTEYRASLLAEYRWSQLHTLSGYYGYDQSDYESDLRDDSEIHTITFGWGWQPSERFNLNVGGGPTYTKRDGDDGTWGTNANFSMRYLLEKGSFAMNASHGTRIDNFSGTDERGDTKFWRAQLDYQRSLTELLGMNVYAGYVKEDRDETTSTTAGLQTISSDIYSVGGGLSYRFLENYSARLAYGFVSSSSDDDNDDYDDHLITFSVSYENEFLQW